MRGRWIMGDAHKLANDRFKRSYSTIVAVGLMVAVAAHVVLFTLLPRWGA